MSSTVSIPSPDVVGLATNSGLTVAASPVLLGRTTAGAGAIEELTAGTSLSLSAGSLNTIQDIRTSATPQFAGLGLGGAWASGYSLITTGAGKVSIADTTDATAYNAASVVLAGGLGVAKTGIFNGNVGIGAIPVARLHSLAANSTTINDVVWTYDSSGNYRNGIANIFDSSNAVNNIMSFLVCNKTTSGQVAPLSLHGDFSAVFNGNVGIGTAGPRGLLDISTTASAANAILEYLFSNAASTGTSFTTLRLEKGSGYGGDISGYLNQSVGAGLSFNVLNAGTSVEAMRIIQNGNVGVGTTSPGVPLDVAGQIRSSSSILTGAPAGGTAGAWKFGIYVAGAPAATGYVQLDIAGILYKLLTST